MAIIEQGVAPGGGAWLGGQLFSAMCVSTLTQPVLIDIRVVFAAQKLGLIPLL